MALTVDFGAVKSQADCRESHFDARVTVVWTLTVNLTALSALLTVGRATIGSAARRTVSKSTVATARRATVRRATVSLASLC